MTGPLHVIDLQSIKLSATYTLRVFLIKQTYYSFYLQKGVTNLWVGLMHPG